MDPYQYTPLNKDEIRLISLLPGDFSDPIVAELRHKVLVDFESPRYEALSYVWGSKDDPKDVHIRDGHISPVERRAEGVSKSLSTLNISRNSHVPKDNLNTLSVTHNLEEALRYLRHKDSQRTLWVDAICIDQANEDERGKEVFRMGDIYNFATRIVIWLGPSGEATDDAFKEIRYIASYAKTIYRDGSLKWNPNTTDGSTRSRYITN